MISYYAPYTLELSPTDRPFLSLQLFCLFYQHHTRSNKQEPTKNQIQIPIC